MVVAQCSFKPRSHFTCDYLATKISSNHRRLVGLNLHKIANYSCFVYICECLHTDRWSLAVICHIFRLLFHDLSPHVGRIIRDESVINVRIYGDHGEHLPHIQPSVFKQSQRSWQTVARIVCHVITRCAPKARHIFAEASPSNSQIWNIVTHVSVSRKGKQTPHVRGKTQCAAVRFCLTFMLERD